MKIEKLKGFTLAEVLITLVIIGVIAALTVPSLIQRTNKQEYVSALKKTYSVLAAAVQMINLEYGGADCSEGGWGCADTDLSALFAKYLQTSQICGFTKCRKNHIRGLMGSDSGHYDFMFPVGTDRSTLVLSDGVQVTIRPLDPCAVIEGAEVKNCVHFIVDINGEKGPNRYGRDVYNLFVRDNILQPSYCYPEGSSRHCPGSDPNNYGKGCSCEVLTTGEMNY